MHRTKLFCLLIFVSLLASSVALAQESTPPQGSPRPFPLKEYEKWDRVPGSASSLSHTQTLSKPGIRVGDAVFEAGCEVKKVSLSIQPNEGETHTCEPKLTLSFELGTSEEFHDPVSGDTVRAYTIAGNAPAFFKWSPLASKPTYVLFPGDGVGFVVGDRVSYIYEWVFTDKGLTVTSVKVVLKDSDGTEKASRIFTRKLALTPPPALPQGEKR